MIPVSSWGRLTADPHHVDDIHDPLKLTHQIAASHPHGRGLAFGMGKSYGDVCLNPQNVLWHMTGLDHFLAFDESNGRLICESGVLLHDIQRLVIPRGWRLPVTPGTQWITVGGAIANDVHGKNHHHRGSFGDGVKRIKLLRTNGEMMECSLDVCSDWLRATIGGLGLTGVIVEVEMQLCRSPGPWFEVETIPYDSLSEFFQLADDSATRWEHTVSWIDCTSPGRGLFMRGKASAAAHLPIPKNRPFKLDHIPPLSVINPLSVRVFNAIYFHHHKKVNRALTYYESFLYPLDRCLPLNRLYGPKGFFQYQCVIPRPNGQEALQDLLIEIKRLGAGSFLTVLKTFGERQAPGILSFPRTGVTLAIDFPNHGQQTAILFSRLDAIVREAKGCLYLAKDARMPRDLFEAGYPHLQEFLNYRDPGISSGLSRRLMGD